MAARPPNLETVTHAAGPEIRVRKRHVQRCAVCGEKLADSDDPKLRKFWTEGELVRAQQVPDSVDGGESMLYSIGQTYSEVNKCPKDFCIELVE